MRGLLGIAFALLCMGSLALGAPTLNYSLSGEYAWGARTLTITAKDGGSDIWSMGLWVPLADANKTNHNVATAGTITSFKDLQHGGTPFDYSPEMAKDVWSDGLMQFNQLQTYGANAGAAFSFDISHTDYFEYTWTSTGLVHLGSASDPTNTVDTVLKVRINAPTVSGGTFATTLEANFRFTNNQATQLNTWYMGTTAGALALSLTDAGTGAFVNPKGSLAKPNVHAAGEHPLYQVNDWYGSRDAATIDGALIEAVVKANDDTAALNMRPGLTFRIDANAMSMNYCGSGAYNTFGATDEQGAKGYFIGSIGQPGSLGTDGLGGNLMIDPGQTMGMQFTGFIGIVPEPATLGLLAIGALALLRRRRK